MIGTSAGKGFAKVDGVAIAYESAGAGDPPVVLVHGGFENRGYFWRQVEHLAPRRRVITLDLRGHGESDTPSSLSMEAFESDVIAVLDTAGAETAILCGHSMAGGVALGVAAAIPDRIRGVALLDAAIFFPDAARQQARDNLLPALNGDQWLAALHGFFGRLVAPNDPPEVAARVNADLDRAQREMVRSFFTSLFGDDFVARQARYAQIVKTMNCPLMYVHATAPADLRLLQSLKPDAMIGQVVGSGHYMMLSAAEQLNAMLDRFLLAVDQAQRP